MGLDWVVIAKKHGDEEINPTEVIGSRRASREDPEIMKEMRRIWEEGRFAQSFDDWADEHTSKDIPPIVVQFGEGFESAIPAVQAEVQFYGYRGKAIEPRFNRTMALAESNGVDMDWLYEDMRDVDTILDRINLLEDVVRNYRTKEPAITDLAERYYQAWRRQLLNRNSEDVVAYRELEAEIRAEEDLEEHVFEIYSVLGARDWLKFWQDKGFVIAADF